MYSQHVCGISCQSKMVKLVLFAAPDYHNLHKIMIRSGQGEKKSHMKGKMLIDGRFVSSVAQLHFDIQHSVFHVAK